MNRLQKITDSLDDHPLLQSIWFVVALTVLMPCALACDFVEMVRQAAEDIRAEWLELRRRQKARRDDNDDDDDLPLDFVAPA